MHVSSLRRASVKILPLCKTEKMLQKLVK